MAESGCATDCAVEKMLVQEAHIQSNGSVSSKDIEFTLEFDPLPQRSIKLNRRGFFLLSREEDKETDKNSSRIVNQCKQNDVNGSKVLHDRLKSPPSGQKKIKLGDSESDKHNGLKRNSTTSNGIDQLPQESPPKKKHKPITWP